MIENANVSSNKFICKILCFDPFGLATPLDIIIGELCQHCNSLWPSDVIQRDRSGSTHQIMACCLTTHVDSVIYLRGTSHELLKILIHKWIWNPTIKITATSLRSQWVKIFSSRYYLQSWRHALPHRDNQDITAIALIDEFHGNNHAHYIRGGSITVTSYWVRWRLKSPASPLFAQLVIQAQIKENIKVRRHWPLCGEFTGDRWIPRTKGQ